MVDIETMLLLYSRTVNRDYRWIFIDSEISQEDSYNIRQDFSTQKNKFARGLVVPQHIYIRCINNGLAFYRVRKTEREDCCGCPIPALEGFSVKHPHVLDFCSMIRELSYDLLHHTTIPIDSPKDKDLNIIRSFTYRSNENHSEEENELSDTIAKIVFQHLKDKGLGNGFLLTHSTERGINIEPLIINRQSSFNLAPDNKKNQNKQVVFSKLLKKISTRHKKQISIEK